MLRITFEAQKKVAVEILEGNSANGAKFLQKLRYSIDQS